MKKLLITLVLLCGINTYAEFKLPHILSDNMVLQRQQDCRIWGLGDNGTEVTVKFKNQAKTTTVKNGKWLITLSPEEHGGPFEMLITHGKETKTIKNILIGEVWLAAGQSNMQMSVMGETEWPRAQNFAHNDQIRLFKQFRNPQGKPAFDTLPATWSADTNASRRHFSAVAYYFARKINQKLGIPVGISLAAEGGTKCQYWTPKEAFEGNHFHKEWLNQAIEASNDFETTKSTYEIEFASWLKKRKDGENVGRHPTHYGRYASFYYNGFIHPIQNFTIRGAIWYQGERNSLSTKDAYSYRTYFPLMIESWRQTFRNPDMPFYFVQLPKMALRDTRDAKVTRESQMHVAKTLKNANMVVTVDKAEPGLHPKTKKYIGDRLGNMALSDVYDQKVDYLFPLYKNSKIKDSSIIIDFDYVGEGLMANDGKELREFTICGEDKKFVPAKAKIVGTAIIVSSPEVSKPVAVRYAWKMAPLVNLVGKNGLPVSPFRTDNYKLPEKNPKEVSVLGSKSR